MRRSASSRARSGIERARAAATTTPMASSAASGWKMAPGSKAIRTGERRATTVPSKSPAVEARAVPARRLVHLAHDELGAAEDVRQHDGPLLVARTEETAMGAVHRLGPAPLALLERADQAGAGALPRHGVVPEGAAARLERRVVRAEGPRPALERAIEREHRLGRCGGPHSRDEPIERRHERRRGLGGIEGVGRSRVHDVNVGLFEARRNGQTAVSMQNRVFFAQPALDAWLADGKAELSG